VLAYWLLFAFFAAGAVLGSRAWYAQTAAGRHDEPRSLNAAYLFGGAAVALLIGLRYQVGGDWSAYQRMFEAVSDINLDAAVMLGDPGYQLLNWMVNQAGLGVWVVNLICGIIFTWGLFRFASRQVNPWLAITVSIPYLVIVVAMGYTRQGVAIGIILAGLSRIGTDGLVKFAFYCGVAALFHKTAVFVLPIIALAPRQNRMITGLLMLTIAGFLYYTLVASSMDKLVTNYIDAEYDSQGAAIRVAMNLPPALLFLFLQRRFNLDETQRRLWRNFSVAAIFCLVLLFLQASSTAVDRMALYVIPLQLFVFASLPGLVRDRGISTTLILSVALYSFAVQFVWLNYADNAMEWLPYRVYPIGSPAEVRPSV